MKFTNLESVFAESLPGPEALRHRERRVPRWEITSDEIGRFKATTAPFETCSEGRESYITLKPANLQRISSKGQKSSCSAETTSSCINTQCTGRLSCAPPTAGSLKDISMTAVFVSLASGHGRY